MSKPRIRSISRIFFATLMLLIVGYSFARAMLPIGSFQYQVKNPAFEPDDRIISAQLIGDTVTQLVDDNIYFSVAAPLELSRATVTIRFENPSDQELLIGFRDRQTWHYATQLIHAPLLDRLPWPKTGSDPVLFQRNVRFSSVAQFFSNPPASPKVGGYYYRQHLTDHIPGYVPSQDFTTISSPRLRGSQTWYTYLDKERFAFKLKVQDLNAAPGADAITVTVFKNDEEVFTQIYPDDGIDAVTPDKQPTQDITIQNPGVENPESGTYKIVFNATTDIVIQEIVTTLHKIVFESPLQLTDHSSPLSLTTTASSVSASAQPVASGSGVYAFPVPPQELTLTGNGFFAYSPDQYFDPMPLYVVPIRQLSDLQGLDYLLTSGYETPSIEGNWKSRTLQFDLQNAVIQNGNLSWIIQAPGLKANQRKVYIKDIQVTLIKE